MARYGTLSLINRLKMLKIMESNGHVRTLEFHTNPSELSGYVASLLSTLLLLISGL
jgi:hypothetical protein